MSRIRPRVLPGAAALVLILLAPLALRGAGPERAAPPASGGPVVIELFTSQGCSSCPPADRLLSKIGADPQLAGKVIPLAFHVDYWDYNGWRDPFSSGRWSGRQQAYARAFRSQRIYTPQLVVGGRAECLGSKEDEVRQRIAEALSTPPAGTVTVEPSAPEKGKLRVKVSAKLERAAQNGQDLWVALYQRRLSTPVKGGENASATLEDDYVVRRLEKALALKAEAGSSGSSEVVLAVDPSWPVRDLGVVAFLQDPRTLAIQGAAAKPLTAP
jgi:hypothetical protein